ncbi:hypothetical protein ACJA23_01945 [Mycoplasma corogypsi]|uniref:hypothetical protein n=1 Tax=Mycoplasma corogypsi TaxID=2106 RepID=UPI003873A26C
MKTNKLNKILKLGALPVIMGSGVSLFVSATDANSGNDEAAALARRVEQAKTRLKGVVDNNTYKDLGGGFAKYQVDLLKAKIDKDVTSDETIASTESYINDFAEAVKFSWAALTTASFGDFTSDAALNEYKKAFTNAQKPVDNFDYKNIWSAGFWGNFKNETDAYKAKLVPLWNILKGNSISEADKVKTFDDVNNFQNKIVEAYSPWFNKGKDGKPNETNDNVRTFFTSFINYPFNIPFWGVKYYRPTDPANADTAMVNTGKRYYSNWNAMFALWMGNYLKSDTNTLNNGDNNIRYGYTSSNGYAVGIFDFTNTNKVPLIKKYSEYKYWLETKTTEFSQAENIPSIWQISASLDRNIKKFNSVEYLLSKLNFADNSVVNFSRHLAIGNDFEGDLKPGALVADINRLGAELNGKVRVNDAKAELGKAIDTLNSRIVNLPESSKAPYAQLASNATTLKTNNERLDDLFEEKRKIEIALANLLVIEELNKLEKAEALVGNTNEFTSLLKAAQRENANSIKNAITANVVGTSEINKFDLVSSYVALVNKYITAEKN